MNRTTKQEMLHVFDHFCKTMGYEQGHDKGQVYISGAYGGHTIHLVMNEGGGVRTLLRYGHVSKRELVQAMRDAMDGVRILEDCKKSSVGVACV